MSPSAIDVSPGAGRARLRADGLAVRDFHDLGNAVSSSPTSRPGHVSFDVRWDGRGTRTKIRDATFGFSGEFVAGNATIGFTAADDGAGVVYTSQASGQKTVSGGVGRERNGVFFASDGEGGDDGEGSG